MLVRELVGGDPPHTCKLILIDDPGAFGHRVMDGVRILEHVLTKPADFELALAEMSAKGFVETASSLTRRVFTTADTFWIIWLDGDTLRTQTGVIRADWRESSGHLRSKEFRDRDRAVAAYHKAIADKWAEGYREEYAREVTLAEASKAPKKTGKKKSR
jgi:predicted DNA-binding WGR domain protein